MTLPFSEPTMGAYTRALAASTDHRFTFDILTLDHVRVMTVEGTYVSGQVNILPGADIDRTMQVTFFDPDHQLQIDADAPSDGALGFDRLIRCNSVLYVPELGRELTVPVFTGVPIVPDRNGDLISIEAQDKACRMLAPRELPRYPIRKGHLLVQAIREALVKCGETKFHFPQDSTTRVHKDTPIGGADENQSAWKVLRRLAKAGGYQLFYDRAGYATLRRTSTEPVVTWEADLDSSTLTDVVQTTTDFTTLRNRVRVTGKKGVHGLAQLPNSHPYSAVRLASGGVPCHMTLWYDDKNIGSDKQANAVAARELGNYEIETVAVQFPCVPIFHVDPLDAARIKTDSWAATFRVREATIPFGDEAMTVGYQARVKVPAAKRIRPKP